MKNPSLPNPAMSPVRFQISRNLFWLRDAQFTLLVDEQRGFTRQLEGDAAELWGWLSIGHSPAQCARLLSVMNDSTLLEAASDINRLLREWRATGILEDDGEKQ
jgi:hypothetical protein